MLQMTQVPESKVTSSNVQTVQNPNIFTFQLYKTEKILTLEERKQENMLEKLPKQLINYPNSF